MKAPILLAASLALAALPGWAATGRTTRVLFPNDTYVVSRTEKEVSFSSKAAKVRLAIEACNRIHVQLVLDGLESELGRAPKIPLQSSRKIKGHLTIEDGPLRFAVPANDPRGHYLANLPTTFAELSVASRRACGH